MCPCYSARVGAFMLALAVCYSASSQILLGVDFNATVADAMRGDFSFGMWAALLFVAVGVWQFVRGVHAALTHDDPIDGRSLLISVVLLVVMAKMWQVTHANAYLDPQLRTGVSAIYIAVMTDSVVNILVQLRGLRRFLPRRRERAPIYAPFPPAPVFVEDAPALLAQAHAALFARDEQISRLRAEQKEFLHLIGGRRAVLSLLHPDNKPEAEKQAATVRFQKAGELLARIERARP